MVDTLVMPKNWTSCKKISSLSIKTQNNKRSCQQKQDLEEESLFSLLKIPCYNLQSKKLTILEQHKEY